MHNTCLLNNDHGDTTTPDVKPVCNINVHVFKIQHKFNIFQQLILEEID